VKKKKFAYFLRKSSSTSAERRLLPVQKKERNQGEPSPMGGRKDQEKMLKGRSLTSLSIQGEGISGSIGEKI